MNAFQVISELIRIFMRFLKETYIPATNYSIWDASISVFCFSVVVAFLKTIFGHANFDKGIQGKKE